VLQEERIERFEDVVGSHLGANDHCQGLPGVFIQNSQHLVAPTVAELVVDEVDGPDVVRMRWPQADGRTVLVIKPSALLMALRELQAFFTP